MGADGWKSDDSSILLIGMVTAAMAGFASYYCAAYRHGRSLDRRPLITTCLLIVIAARRGRWDSSVRIGLQESQRRSAKSGRTDPHERAIHTGDLRRCPLRNGHAVQPDAGALIAGFSAQQAVAAFLSSLRGQKQ
jgi:hypothetical protein